MDFTFLSENNVVIVYEYDDRYMNDKKSVYFMIRKNNTGVVYPPYKYLKSENIYRSELIVSNNGSSVTTSVMTIPTTHFIFYNDYNIIENRDRVISDVVS